MLPEELPLDPVNSVNPAVFTGQQNHRGIKVLPHGYAAGNSGRTAIIVFILVIQIQMPDAAAALFVKSVNITVSGCGINTFRVKGRMQGRKESAHTGAYGRTPNHFQINLVLKLGNRNRHVHINLR